VASKPVHAGILVAVAALRADGVVASNGSRLRIGLRSGKSKTHLTRCSRCATRPPEHGVPLTAAQSSEQIAAFVAMRILK